MVKTDLLALERQTRRLRRSLSEIRKLFKEERLPIKKEVHFSLDVLAREITHTWILDSDFLHAPPEELLQDLISDQGPFEHHRFTEGEGAAIERALPLIQQKMTRQHLWCASSPGSGH